MPNATSETATKTSVFSVKGENISPSATTVARSFTKQAARTVLP
jgi:hypothetical protein